MRIHPLLPLFLPFVWTYTGGLFLRPLTVALGSVNPDLSASAWQAVLFIGSATFSGWAIGQAVKGEPTQVEYTSSDLRRALLEGREQEREASEKAHQYALTVSVTPPGNLKIVLGHNARAFHFPAGVGVDQLLALAECVGNGNHPTDRALVPPFERGTGKSFELMRDWMLYGSSHHKPGELAVKRSERNDWTLTDTGLQVLLMWLSALSPIQHGVRVKKARVTLSNTIREQLSNQKQSDLS